MIKRSSQVLLVTTLASLLGACGGSDNSNTAAVPPTSNAGSGTAETPPAPTVKSNFPVLIGQVGPIAADNIRQQPFACVSQDSSVGLGQPEIDNQNGIGFPVKDASGKIIGFSADCGVKTQVDYYYRKATDANGVDLSKYDLKNPPTDVKTIKVGGKDVKYIVRFERGTINRFLYSIALLTPNPDPAKPEGIDFSVWNKDLIFDFAGGTGVGHQQAHIGNATRGIQNPNQGGNEMPYLLEQGYAVAFSSGTSTSTTYELKLTGQTATMLKEQFTAAYAKPRFTFGVGGSGGAVQQTIYAQNNPGLLDGAIPIENFPDMITQVNPVGDCELLHYYFDKVDAQVNGTGLVDPKWTTWANRSLVAGFPFLEGYVNSNTPGTSAGAGIDGCIAAWRGAVPSFFDPYWGQTHSMESSYNIAGISLTSTYWGYFNDLVGIFTGSPNAKPTANTPYTYDNEGLQYGLVALKSGKITPDQFLNLNAHVGGWKEPQDFLPQGVPYGPGTGLDPWSARNATAISHMADKNDIAPRTVATPASLTAMQNAYKAGIVFRGNVNIPMINLEPYLEGELNMHASREPFATRQRLIAAKGNADNQVIWMTHPSAANGNNLVPYILQALQVETNWLLAGSRPATVQDTCYADGGSGIGNVIASGKNVWDGQVAADGTFSADKTKGACTNVYPMYSNPRLASGAPVSGSIFKCALKPVAMALRDGTYSGVTFSSDQQVRLSNIFSTGVCDYSKPDQGLPVGA